jgi:hypothetical protein
MNGGQWPRRPLLLLGPSEMHSRDLVLALSDDIVVRQRLGNHAPWPAMQSMERLLAAVPLTSNNVHGH